MRKLISFLFCKETLLYLICGVLTTLVSFGSLKLLSVIFGEKYYLFCNSLAWLLAVVFAYITNKLLVFESKSWKKDVLKKEIPSFFLARVMSYFIEEGVLWLFMSVLNFEGKTLNFHLFSISGLMTAKAVAGVLVIIINYVFSKLVIFKKTNGS